MSLAFAGLTIPGPGQEPYLPSEMCCVTNDDRAARRFGLEAMLRDPQTLLTILCGVFLAISFLLRQSSLAYLSVLCGSFFALQTAYNSLVKRAIDVNLLMVLAAIGAIIVGQPADAAALLFLFSLSSTLEAYAMARTRSAIEGLVQLRPDTALRLVGDREERVKVEDLELDDLVRIPPFTAIPVDGVITQGLGSIDQSAMTGESIPVEKGEGEPLLAGTQNMYGNLVMRVTSTVGDSTLDKIVGLVQNAQTNKASGERISTWFGQRYTFLVLGAFGLSLGLRLVYHQELPVALYGALTLLVALSPCALVISTPATTLSALAWAAKNGVLVRGGEYIELAGQIDTVALDKTGTLTTGKPQLVEICLCSHAPVAVGAGQVTCVDEEACWRHGGNMSPEARDILRAAAVAESYAAHPIADAITQAARDFGIEVPLGADHVTEPGLGVSAIVDGMQVHIGQRRYLDAVGAPMEPEFVEHLRELQTRGLTIAIVAYGDRLAALGFKDGPRPEAREFLRELKQLGIKRTLMITGDTEQTARSIAAEVGLDEVRAGLLPDGKTKVVDELVKGGGKVMMVGDGINDAPSLAGATVGVAMGGLGSDIALNAAQVVLMRDRLQSIPDLIRLGRKTNRIVRANLVFASGVIICLTLASLATKLPLPLAVVGHEGSTVIVILNGLRLLRGPGPFRPQRLA